MQKRKELTFVKTYYLSLMAKTLSAYSDAHIVRYFELVKRHGLREHGFPRLTANIGILISYGIRTDLLPLFTEMMDFCCDMIPRVKAANDFSVREIVFCIMELEAHRTVPQSRIDRYKENLRTILPETCYDRFARTTEDKVFNWAAFTALSEYMRQYIGLCDSTEFVDIQIPTQLRWMDENGMYRDAEIHPPMVYDLVTRGLFSLLLHFGYRGKYCGRSTTVSEKRGFAR